MITQQTQIKINLPLQLKDYLESKASKYGIPLAGYIKHLIIEDISDMDYPEFMASKKTEQSYKKAIKDRKKAIKVKSISEYFKNI